MADPDRDEPVWYYQLGDEVIGPVSWREIEELLADTFDAKELLVARAGDRKWRSAQEIIDEFEEAEAEDEDAEEADAAEEAPPKPLTPVFGLKPWLAQGWRIVSDDLRRFVAADILLIALSAVSLMVCFSALHAGLYDMALKRFRGEVQENLGVVAGFRYFGRALGLYLVLFVIGLPLGVVAMLGLVALLIVFQARPEVQLLSLLSTWFFWIVVSLGMALPGAAAFFAMPLIVERDMGAMEAVKASWALTRSDYFSYLGMTIVFGFLSALGGVICWIGLVITLPILPAAQVCVYKHYFRDEA